MVHGHWIDGVIWGPKNCPPVTCGQDGFPCIFCMYIEKMVVVGVHHCIGDTERELTCVSPRVVSWSSESDQQDKSSLYSAMTYRIHWSLSWCVVSRWLLDDSRSRWAVQLPKQADKYFQTPNGPGAWLQSRNNLYKLSREPYLWHSEKHRSVGYVTRTTRLLFNSSKRITISDGKSTLWPFFNPEPSLEFTGTPATVTPTGPSSNKTNNLQSSWYCECPRGPLLFKFKDKDREIGRFKLIPSHSALST